MHLIEAWFPDLPPLLELAILASQEWTCLKGGRSSLPEALKPLSQVPAGPLPPPVLSATTVLLQGLKEISSSEMETAQVGYDNQEDNLEGYLQAP